MHICCSAPSTGPLGNGLHAIWGPVYYETTPAPTAESPQEMPSLVKDGTFPAPEEARLQMGLPQVILVCGLR